MELINLIISNQNTIWTYGKSVDIVLYLVEYDEMEEARVEIQKWL